MTDAPLPKVCLADTPALKLIMIEAYRTQQSVRSSALACGVNVSTARNWMRNDEDFKAKMNEAHLDYTEAYADQLRKTLKERAEGIMRPVLYKGEVMHQRDAEGNVILDANFEPAILYEEIRSDPVLLRNAEAHLAEYKRAGSGGVGLSIGGSGDGETPLKIEVRFQDPPDWDNVVWDPETGRAVLPPIDEGEIIDGEVVHEEG